MVAGLQYAGGHLRELQQALKNPAANMGLILGEGTKRAKRAIGFTNGGTIEGIHPNLSESAQLLGRVCMAMDFLCSTSLYYTNYFCEKKILININKYWSKEKPTCS